MNRRHLSADEEVPMNLFRAATIKDQEKAKQHHIEMIKEGQINIFEVGQREETDMQKQAIKKLQDEMAVSAANTYVQAVGAYLVNLVQNEEGSAEKILAEGKTIAGSLNAMRQEAEKKKQNNMAVIAPDEGFAIVAKYFGIKVDGVSAVITNVSTNPAPVVLKPDVEEHINVPNEPKKRFDASLDEFL